MREIGENVMQAEVGLYGSTKLCVNQVFERGDLVDSCCEMEK